MQGGGGGGGGGGDNSESLKSKVRSKNLFLHGF